MQLVPTLAVPPCRMASSLLFLSACPASSSCTHHNVAASPQPPDSWSCFSHNLRQRKTPMDLVPTLNLAPNPLTAFAHLAARCSPSSTSLASRLPLPQRRPPLPWFRSRLLKGALACKQLGFQAVHQAVHFNSGLTHVQVRFRLCTQLHTHPPMPLHYSKAEQHRITHSRSSP